MSRPIVVLDTETAASRGAPHLVELAALHVVEGEVVDQFESLVRPEVPIEPEAQALHGIGADDVAGARSAREVLAAFLDWLGDDWMAAHDAPKDARVLGFELARARLAAPAAPWICTLRLARKLFPEARDHRLETLCELFELEDGPRHRALADATWTLAVLLACAERAALSSSDPPGGSPTVPQADPLAAERLLALAGGVPTTIAGHGPSPPRLKPSWRAISRACGSGQALRLWYGSPEEAPVELAVAPQLLYRAGEKGYLEAECLATGTIKTYRLDRIRRVSEGR